MKTTYHSLLGFVAFALIFIVAGCGKNPATSGQSLDKSSTIVLKTTAKQTTTVNSQDIPVPGGTVHLSAALFNIQKIQIEENSGVENEQEGEHEDNDNDSDSEQEAPDIIVVGPFSFDISSGEVVIDSVAVYPGTFKQVDFTFVPSATPPFSGATIVMLGEFTPDNGTAIAFTLKSEFAQEIQSRIAGNGITITENTVVPVVVTFDLAGLFKGLDFGTAQLTGGQILVDSSNNASLLAAFEANLSRYVEVEQED